MNTPLATQFLLSALHCTTNAVEKNLMFFILFESVLDNFMYLMICTRLDITFVVGKVNKYMSNPSKIYREEIKWILSNIKALQEINYCLMSKVMNVKSLWFMWMLIMGKTWTRGNQRLYMFSLLHVAALVENLLLKNASLGIHGS